MRVVLDANVVIGAVAVEGACRALVRRCLHAHELVLSEYILEEVRRNLTRKLRMPAETAQAVVDVLRAQAHLVEPQAVERRACRHAKDLPVFGTALAGEARCIVTGDGHLLALKSFRGVTIVPPAEFFRFEEEGPPRAPRRRRRRKPGGR